MAQFCSACGGQMADGATTCPGCGKSVSTGGGAAAQMAPAQSAGLAPNLAGALAYLFIPAIIFLAMEPYNRDRTIRFHAFQGLFLGLTSIVGHIVLSFIPIIGWILMPFFGLAIFILAVVAAVKAFGNTKWKVPMIGDMAEKQANS